MCIYIHIYNRDVRVPVAVGGRGGSNLSGRSLFARRVPRRACSEKMGRATGRKICTDRQTDEYRDTSVAGHR